MKYIQIDKYNTTIKNSKGSFHNIQALCLKIKELNKLKKLKLILVFNNFQLNHIHLSLNLNAQF